MHPPRNIALVALVLFVASFAPTGVVAAVDLLPPLEFPDLPRGAPLSASQRAQVTTYTTQCLALAVGAQVQNSPWWKFTCTGTPSSGSQVRSGYDFYPIVPLPPGVSGQGVMSLADYLNALFRVSIIVSSALAVLMIVVGGFEYIASEALGGKTKGRERIQGAVVGLILLLASYLILYVINPNILNLNFIHPLSEMPTPTSETVKPYYTIVTARNIRYVGYPAGTECPRTITADGGAWRLYSKLPGTSACDPDGERDDIGVCCMYRPLQQ